MRREYLIGIITALAIVGGVFAVYQFYLKERLQVYADDALRLDQLEEKYLALSEKFNNTKPEEVIKDVRSRVEPWREAVEERATYFNIGDRQKTDPIPDDVLSYKLYYMEKAPEVYNSFNEYLRNAGKAESVNVDLWFRAPNPQNITDLRPNKLEVAVWFQAMQFGHSFVRMFVDANAIRLKQVRFWKKRVDRQVLDAFTTGVEFEMTMTDLVGLFDDLRFNRERYYDVNGFRIKNPYLLGDWATDPWLQVEMLVTMTEFKPGAPVQVTQSSGGAGGTQGGGAIGSLFGNARNREEEPPPKRPFLDRLIQWFPF